MKIIIDFIVLILIYIGIYHKKWRFIEKDVLLVNTLMYIYLSFVLYFTLMPIVSSLLFIFNHPYVPMNLVPFSDVLEGRGDFIRQIILNVIMMIPFGFLFPLTQKTKSKFIKTIFYTFILSLCIEFLQPLINGVRSSDITDLITNILGGMIGYFFYIVFKPITLNVLKYIKNK